MKRKRGLERTERIRKLSLNQKINLTLIALFCFLTLIFLLIMIYVSAVLDRRTNEFADTNLRNIMKDFESTIAMIEGYGDYFLGDGILQQNLSIISDSDNLSDELRAKRRISDQLDSVLDTMDYIRNITLVLTPYETINSGNGFTITRAEAEDINSIASGLNGRPYYFQDGGYMYYVRDIRRKENLALDHLAYLYLKIDIAQMMHVLHQEYDLSGVCFEILYRGNVVFDDVPDGVETGRYHLSSGRMSGDFSYQAYIPSDSISDDLMPLFLLSISALMLCSIVSLVAGRKLMHSFAYHLNVLEEKMAGFEADSFNPAAFPSYEKRNDEIGKVHRHFDRMAENSKKLIADNYEKELAVRDAQIRMLSSQINPHFLYNVLNSIYLMAEEADSPDIARMAYSLASLFRIATSDRKILVSLADETAYLRHYTEIQKIRFSERLEFIEEIDAGLMRQMVPRFSIQPLVENAIKHSMEQSTEKCVITLAVRKDGEDMMISVSNTGSNFPPDMAERIRTRGMNEGSGLGLYNINERLSLLFSSQLEFRNDGDNAIVSFRLPLKEHADV